MAQATLTAPVIFSTAAGTGGPLLWNNSAAGGKAGVNAALIAVGMGISVASTVAAAFGITGNTGQSAAPTTTTAIDAVSCTYLAGWGASNAITPQCNVFRVGTVTNAGGGLIPIGEVSTGALTTEEGAMRWWDITPLGVIVPPGAWASPSVSATATTLQCIIGLIWEEITIQG